MVAAAIAGGCLAALATFAPPPASAHPMHTSLAELTLDAPGGRIGVSVRIFADDFAAAIAAAGGGGARTPADSLALAYVRRSLTLASASGPVTLVPRALRRAGDVVWAEFEAPASARPTLVHDGVLFDRYADQVNIVRVLRGGHAATLLFTRGDRPKPLP